MKQKFIFFLFIVIILFLGYWMFGQPKVAVQRGDKLRVTTSFYPLYFFAKEIGGDYADVINITPAGAEPHEYDPSASDFAHMEKANMLVLNGGVEPWADKVQSNLKDSDVEIVIAGKNLLTQTVEEEGETVADPHIWLDPVVAKQEIHAIVTGYKTIDSKHASYYDGSEALLNKKLDALDEAYQKILAHCAKKDFVTSHAAFGYLASRYGLRQVPIAGLSPEEEPSAKQLVEISNFVKTNRVKYIFFESLVSPKLSQTIAAEVGANTLVLDPIEGISDDDIKDGKDYFTIMQDNLKNLSTALECKL